MMYEEAAQLRPDDLVKWVDPSGMESKRVIRIDGFILLPNYIKIDGRNVHGLREYIVCPLSELSEVKGWD